ncbi:unnamed protein product, partial [Mesorhabditis spiculigera]
MDNATYLRNRELRKACYDLLMTDRVPEGWPGTQKWEQDGPQPRGRETQTRLGGIQTTVFAVCCLFGNN